MRKIITFIFALTQHSQENDCFFATIGGFSPWGPTGGHLLTGQVAQWFTNTCLLDFAAFSPALACWTCCIFTSF